eukprot:12586466-Heterocapsa_arctica.AAC.1
MNEQKPATGHTGNAQGRATAPAWTKVTTPSGTVTKEISRSVDTGLAAIGTRTGSLNQQACETKDPS